MTILEGNKVVKRFGGLKAVNEVDFKVNKGEIVGLVGPNGSGKTTLINVINGIYKPDSGSVYLDGEEITGLKPNIICRKGIGRTFQIARPLSRLTVLENLMLGYLFGKDRKTSSEEAREKGLSLLKTTDFPLDKDALVGRLNVVGIKYVQLLQALATDPKVLLLDEVMTGLNPSEQKRIVDVIFNLRKERGITFVVIEHIMRIIMDICDRMLVLHHGKKIAEGTPQEISKDEEVIRAFLGEKYLF